MGFYIRKSFRAGPVRFNLSKSGVGVSAGVTGARIGISSDGRAYSHVGRHGIYAREYYGGTRTERDRAERTAPTARAPIEIVTDTGTTYGSPVGESGLASQGDQLTREVPPHGVHLFLLLAGVTLVGASGYYAISTQKSVALILFALLLSLFLVGTRAARNSLRKTRAGDALGAVLENVRAIGAVDDRLSREIQALIKSPLLRDCDRRYFSQISYLQLLARALVDRRVEDDEHRALSSLAAALDLPNDLRDKWATAAFRTHFLEAISDHDLTEVEEDVLSHIRDRLGIPDSTIAEELALVHELKSVRVILHGDLPVLESPVTLRSGELCHFVSEGRILKSRVLQSCQRDGQRFKVRGLEVHQEGRLVITNRRVLLLHDGTTAVPLGKILDTELDWDSKLITISRDGVQAPLLITTPNAAIAGAILSQLTNRRSNP